MCGLSIINISDNLKDYKSNINDFLSKLDTEKKYMALSIDRILGSPLVIAVFDGNKIIGLTGLEKRLFFFCTFIILNKSYQGKGLGKKLTTELLKESQTTGKFIFSIMLVENMASFRQHVAVGAKKIGIRKNTYYLYFPPPGIMGYVLLFFFKIFFPLIKIYDLKLYIKGLIK